MDDWPGKEAQSEHQCRCVNKQQKAMLAAGENVACDVADPAVRAQFHIAQHGVNTQE